MDKFCLGIIGRCLACQPWMPPSDLYHRRMRTMLQERDGITLQVSLSGRSDLEPYERMCVLHTKKPLDGVLYHMRHVTEQTLLYSSRDSLGQLRYSLHPYFFKRFLTKQQLVYDDGDAVRIALSMRKNKDSDDLFDVPPPPCQPSTRKLLGIPLRQVNLWGGKICGLNAYAIAKEWIFFERLRCLCLKLNIPIFVLGPVPTVEMLEEEKKSLLLEQVRRFTEPKLSKYDIPNYFLHSLRDEVGRPLHKADRVHLASEGHAFLAKELYPVISSWIRSILSGNQKSD